MRNAKSLADLLRIRRAHEKSLDELDGPYGTAVGKKGDDPALLVFVERKIHENWLTKMSCVPPFLEADGVRCPTDVFQVGGGRCRSRTSPVPNSGLG